MERARRIAGGSQRRSRCPPHEVWRSKTHCPARAPLGALATWRTGSLQCRRDRENRKLSTAFNQWLRDQRLSVRQGWRHLGEFRHGRKQRIKVAKQVADEAICHVAVQVRMMLEKNAEAERMVIERID